MSYDISFRRKVENMEGELYLNESFNMTSNVGPMYDTAAANGFWIGDLDKMNTKDVVAKIQPIYGYMIEHPDEMRTLEPENGWGDYESALKFLKEIIVTCLDHPECFVEVSV